MPPPVPAQEQDRYLTVINLDIERFGRFTDAQSTRAATVFRDAIEHAFERAGLAKTYAAHAFVQNTGDGIVAGFDAGRLPQIVDRIPGALQFGLRELHRRDGLGLRMRMGVSYGPVHGIADQRVDVSPNRTIVEACRIADARATRSLLERSDPEVTFLAAALTAPVFDFTVNRDPLWLKPSEFVAVDIEAKEYRATAYLHVPAPSGALLRSGVLDHEAPAASGGEPPEEPVERPAGPGPVNGTATGSQATQIGRIGGDHQDERIAVGPVSGDDAVIARTVRQDRSTNTYIAGDNITAERERPDGPHGGAGPPCRSARPGRRAGTWGRPADGGRSRGASIRTAG
jgi:hypothetical protein